MRLITLLLAVTVIGCTILRSDPEQKVNELLQSFRDEIKKPAGNNDILKLFETDQTGESIMAAVEVMRNSEVPRVVCNVMYDQMIIVNDTAGFRVVIPASFDVDTLTVTSEKSATFTLWLKESQNKLVITRLEAETFYQTFSALRGEVYWLLEERELLDRHKKYFRTAARLEEMYDSVVWVTEYKGNDYYYVTNGFWEMKGEKEHTGKIGVVDSLGNVIVPLEYDLIGNPGVLGEDIVEVKSGYVGTFDLNKKSVVISPEYYWIIPYEEGGAKALVKNDTTIGWINNKLQFTAGFPNAEAKRFFESYEYLPQNFSINYQTQSLLEHPYESNFGDGTFITPQYLTGVFAPFYENLAMDEQLFRAWLGSVEGGKDLLESLSSQFSAFITSVTSHYIEGRQDFYTERKVNFIAEDGTILKEINVASGDVALRKIDSTLVELKVTFARDPMEYIGEADGFVSNIPSYDYISLDGDEPVVLSSNRKYNFTQYTKIDSSYISGNFVFYGDGSAEEVSFMNDATINDIRIDILADYQFEFDDPAIKERLSDRAGYAPAYTSFTEIEPNLSDIDRHNLNFLARILGPLPGQKPL